MTESEILSELRQLEPTFHAAYPKATVQDFELLVDENFWEIGASGKTYDRAFALHTLKNRASIPSPTMWQTSDYAVRKVGDSVFLLTYTLTQPMRITKRLSVWEATPHGWKVVFHQGTVVNH